MTTAELVQALVRIAQAFPCANDLPRWYLFGSALHDCERAADFDLAIVCGPEDAVPVREHLSPWCMAWPLHLTILTPAEDALLQFTAAQGAIQFYPAARI